MQLERQECYINKVILRTEDDNQDEFQSADHQTNVVITDTDLEWDIPDEENIDNIVVSLNDDGGEGGSGKGGGGGVKGKKTTTGVGTEDKKEVELIDM
jgi:hypothetical protein